MRYLFAAALALLAMQYTQASAALRGFSEVSPGIFRSARPVEADMPFLLQQGIKTIVNLQGGDFANNVVIGPFVPLFESGESPAELFRARITAEKYGFQYYGFPLNSLGPFSPSDAEKVETVLRMMDEPRFHPILIQCGKGIDRTGLVVALYRITRQNWSVHDAYAEMIKQGRNLIHRLFTWHIGQFFFTYARAWVQENDSERLAEVNAEACARDLAIEPTY